MSNAQALDLNYDQTLRAALSIELLKTTAANSRIIHELGICAHAVRIDLATVDDELLCGYEIKSSGDTLQRLKRQIRWYNRVFDHLTIVTTEKHLSAIAQTIPIFWGIYVVKNELDSSSFQIEIVRASEPNPKLEPYAIAQFLWRDEALEFLRLHNIKGFTKKDRREIWTAVATQIPTARVRQHIRYVLRNRPAWLNDNGGRKSKSVELA
jgi:hypothetical protein